LKGLITLYPNSEHMDTDILYPIGKAQDQPFPPSGPFSETALKQLLNDIRQLPGILEQAVLNMDEAEQDTPYRPGGWTTRQLVHHVADSHMNGFIRFKLALTEDNPTIKPYKQDAWAILSDSTRLPVNLSLTLLHALHARWYELMKNMSVEDWQRTVFHPEQERNLSLWHMLGIYAWHGRHHTAQILQTREK
jgi:hypothetical protein